MILQNVENALYQFGRVSNEQQGRPDTLAPIDPLKIFEMIRQVEVMRDLARLSKQIGADPVFSPGFTITL